MSYFAIYKHVCSPTLVFDPYVIAVLRKIDTCHGEMLCWGRRVGDESRMGHSRPKEFKSKSKVILGYLVHTAVEGLES